jgi:hypothetical protein
MSDKKLFVERRPEGDYAVWYISEKNNTKTFVLALK